MNAFKLSTQSLGGDMDPIQSNPGNCSSSEKTTECSEAVRELDRYRTFLRLQAMRLTPNYPARIEASDIVQQTMMEACEKMEQFRGRTEPEMAKWLSQMLKNNISDAARALRRKKRDISRERPLQRDTSGCMSPSDWLAADQATPSICASNAEDLLKLADAIKSLPQAQQDVVSLHHLEGKTVAEVASHLERSVSSVAGLLYRGLKSIRETMNR